MAILKLNGLSTKNAPDPQSPARPLTLLDSACIGVNAIVGSSIFLFPGTLAGQLGPASIFAFGLTALLLAPVALCFAQASANFDRPGGPYLYATAVFGKHAGFGVGWMCWVAEIFSWAAVADGIAAYVSYFGNAWASPWLVKEIAAGTIVMFATLNYRGVKLGALTSDFLAAAKLLPLAIFIVIGLPHVRSANLLPFAPHGWAPIGKACFLAYFAFSGFEVVPVPAGEIDRPHRNVPLAVAGSLAFSAILYMMIQAVAVGVHPAISGSVRPLADAAAVFLGPAGAALMVLGAVISTTGFTAGSALGGPRYLVALAQDGHLPPVFAKPHPRFHTPHLAIAATAGITLAAALLLDFNKLVDFTLVVICVQYVATCAAAPLLGRSSNGKNQAENIVLPSFPPGNARQGPRTNWARSSRTVSESQVEPKNSVMLPDGWLLPILGIAATIWLGAQGGLAELEWAVVTLILGFLLRASWRLFGPAS